MRNNNIDARLALPSQANSESTIGRPSLTATGSAQNLRVTQIIKTTRIDIEKGPEMEPTNNQCKPSLEIDLGSPFLVDRHPEYEL